MRQTEYQEIQVTSTAFSEGGEIPVRYTGRGEDLSPDLILGRIEAEASSIAVIMNDLDVPMMRDYNHWLIWNIPVQNVIPEGLPHGPAIELLEGAVQGVGYGKHKYRGPKPPGFIRKAHRYEFHVYVLDCRLNLKSSSRKRELMEAMDGHILQHGCLMGTFQNPR